MKSGALKLNYRKCIKPLVMKGVPEFRYAVLIEDKSVIPAQRTYIRNLKAIPQEYTNLTAQHQKVLIRQEGGTTLQAIKKFHHSVAKAQGLTEEEFKEHCRKVDISLDGVAESPHAKRTMYILSVRFGQSIYIWRVYNYLTGVTNAKPTVDQVLR